jgi:hypothetical protein
MRGTLFHNPSPQGPDHKVHIYLDCHSICLLVRIGPTDFPLSQGSLSPPGTKGGDTLAAVEGVWGPNTDDWRKSLALCLP